VGSLGFEFICWAWAEKATSARANERRDVRTRLNGLIVEILCPLQGTIKKVMNWEGSSDERPRGDPPYLKAYQYFSPAVTIYRSYW